MPETETELDRLARELLQKPLSEAKAPPEVWERAQQIASEKWRRDAERLEAEHARLIG